MWPASRSALIAPWQPMKPTQVRSTAGLQREALDQREVDPRRREPGARDQQEVRDALQIVVEVERGRERKIGGARPVDAHARAGVGETPRDIEPGVVELVGPPRRQHRMPPLDPAALDHALEQASVAMALQQTGRIGREQAVHLVGRNRGPDRVQKCASLLAHGGRPCRQGGNRTPADCSRLAAVTWVRDVAIEERPLPRVVPDDQKERRSASTDRARLPAIAIEAPGREALEASLLREGGKRRRARAGRPEGRDGLEPAIGPRSRARDGR